MWKIEYTEKATKKLLKIDKNTAKIIKKYLDTRIATENDPRRFGESLTENLTGLWKYRIGDYRVITEIQEEKIIILVVKIGHRKDIYKSK